MPSESATCAPTLMDNIHTTTALLQTPCTRMLHKELSSSFSPPKCSCVDAVSRPLSLAERLLQKNSATRNEAITSEHLAINDMSRSLQDILNNHRFPYLSSDSNISLLHKKHPLQVPLTTNVVNAAVTQASHSHAIMSIHFKSVSFPNTEGIYDDIYSVALPRHSIVPKG